MDDAQRATWLLEGKSCKDCFFKTTCEKDKENLLVCEEFYRPIPELKVLRTGFPNLISSELFEVQPMASHEEGIFSIMPIYEEGD